MTMHPEQLSFEFYLLGLIILLALIAAIGAWRKPRVLSREEAEDLFAHSHERHSGEAQRLRDALAESQKATADKLIALRGEVHDLLNAMREVLDRTTTELRGTVTQAAERQQEDLSRKLGDLSTTVATALTEAKRSQDEGITKVEGTLQQVRADVDRASTEVRTSIVELQRQHNEAKAQSAIQLCEALISSLGTLRNTIAAQIADSRPAELISDTRTVPNSEAANVHHAGFETGTGPENAPEGPQDMDSVPPDSQVAPS
jgi:hypothetical protein